MNRQVEWAKDGWLSVIETGPGIGTRARLFYRQPDGSFTPPLPSDIRVPEAPALRSSTIGTTMTRSATAPVTTAKPSKTRQRPSWQLREREAWRLR